MPVALTVWVNVTEQLCVGDGVGDGHRIELSVWVMNTDQLCLCG